MVKPYVGQVEANSASSVSFPTAGTIKRIYVDEGQQVNKGQLLVEIDPMILQKALQSAEALFSQAQDAYERMKFLHDNNSLPEIQWVETQSRLSQAQSAYDIARKNLADSRLLAPISGVIGRKFAQTGETVMPAQPRDDRTRHKQGKSECIHSGERDRWHTRGYGVRRVRRGSRRGFVQGRTYREERTERPHDAYISHQHSRGQSRGRLLLGMVCDVTFGQTGTPLSVPITAVMAGTGDSRYVWVVENGTAKRKDIRTGMAYGGRIVVTEACRPEIASS